MSDVSDDEEGNSAFEAVVWDNYYPALEAQPDNLPPELPDDRHIIVKTLSGKTFVVNTLLCAAPRVMTARVLNTEDAFERSGAGGFLLQSAKNFGKPVQWIHKTTTEKHVDYWSEFSPVYQDE